MQKNISHEMSPNPETVRPEDALETASVKMSVKKVRHLPVVDGTGKLVGLISARDLAQARRTESSCDGTVNSIMSAPVISLPEDADLLDAVNLMIEKRISAVVIKRHEVVVGIITQYDLLQKLAQLLKPSSLLSPATIKVFIDELAIAGL